MDILLVATYEEGRSLGARGSTSNLHLGDLQVFSAAAHPYTFEGLRLNAVFFTDSAGESRNFDDIALILNRALWKAR